MNIPSTLIVGTYTYRIVEKETVLTDDKAGLNWAHCSSIDQVIQVQSTMSDERKRAALLHELLHAMDDAYGNIGLSEEQVTRLAPALGALFTQNDMRFMLPGVAKK